MKTRKDKIKVFRNGEPVDPQSTQIRSDQAAKLKMERPALVRKVERSEPVKLVSKEPVAVHHPGKRVIKCGGCGKASPTKTMYEYKSSNRGPVVLCDRCNDDAEIRSFRKLDALDSPRKEYKVEE